MSSHTPIDGVFESRNSRNTKKKEGKYIYVNVVYVYERILEKGCRYIFILKAVANHYYFKNQMDNAAKWYAELFEMTNVVEHLYYYRFADALKKYRKKITRKFFE